MLVIARQVLAQGLQYRASGARYEITNRPPAEEKPNKRWVDVDGKWYRPSRKYGTESQ